MNNRILKTGLGVVVASTLIATPLAAHATPVSSAPAQSSTLVDTVWELPAQDWIDIAAKARGAGDTEGAPWSPR